MKTATKHPIGTTLATATAANHPQSPDQDGVRSMSGRHHPAPPPLVPAQPKGRVGGGTAPNSKGFTPVAHPAVMAAKPGFKPGRRSGGGRFAGSK